MSLNGVLDLQQIDLLNAISGKNYQKTKFIVESGLPLNFIDPDGFAPLHYAVIAGLDYTSLLLDHGAQIATKSPHYSPLMLACITKAYDIVKVILQKVPDCKKTLTLPTGELSTAIRNENRELANILINAYDSPHKEFNYTALHQAVENKDVNKVLDIIKSSSVGSINQKDTFGYTPLHLAVFANSPEIVSLLLNNGANPNLATSRGHNAFDLANQKGFSEIIDALQNANNNLFPILTPSSLAAEISAWLSPYLKNLKFILGYGEQNISSKPSVSNDELENILSLSYQSWMLNNSLEKPSLTKILLEHGFNNQIKDMDLSKFMNIFNIFNTDGIEFINDQFNGHLENIQIQATFNDCLFRAFECLYCEFKPGTKFNNVTFRDTFIHNSTFNEVSFNNNHFFYSRFVEDDFNKLTAKNNYFYGGELWNIQLHAPFVKELSIHESDISNIAGVIDSEWTARTKPLIGILGHVNQLQDFSNPGFMAAEPYLRIKQGGALPYLIAPQTIYHELNIENLNQEVSKFLEQIDKSALKQSIVQELLTADLPNINALNNFAKSFADKLDGIWIPGGADIDYRLYGKAFANEGSYYGQIEDQLFEFALVDQMLRQNKPILGICHGAQLLNVYFGGTLLQHVEGHYQVIQDMEILTHEGRFAQAFTNDTIRGLSVHHQAIDDLASPLEKIAIFDNVIKAAQGINYPVYLSQFHPEYLLDDTNMAMLDAFFNAVKEDYTTRHLRSAINVLELTEVFSDINPSSFELNESVNSMNPLSSPSLLAEQLEYHANEPLWG